MKSEALTAVRPSRSARLAHPARIAGLAQAFLAAIVLLAGLFAMAGAAHAQDAGDGKDHPLLGRMPGFTVLEKSVHDFDAVDLKDYEVKGAIGGKPQAFHAEGRVTAIKYLDESQKTSTLAIYRNYANALKQAGAQQLNAGFDQTASDVAGAYHVFRVPNRNGGAPTFVLLYINSPQWYSLTFVEPAQMAQSVKAADLAQAIQATGKATLHINFDTGKAALKDDGVATVREIAALMKGDPALKLSIEGHTDNVGTPAANRALSLARARAVSDAVAAQGIAPARLSAQGYGADKPVADNATEEGRAANRRVELVKTK